ncbi:MAG: response regulator [Myxococcales bacterium]|nr:response regulator [Myxococcales bacterium]
MTDLPRILVVDDEEAILETMTFTFQDEYEVITSTDAREALELLDEKAPIAAVLTDQRMPGMSGVDFVSEVWKRHPATVRMILTGFSDVDATIQAINDGHVYAYITKPWEPDQLKQIMKQAVDHYQLTCENERLLEAQKRANQFLEAVMDQLDTGAIAVDDQGVIQAMNRPVRAYLALDEDFRGRPLEEVLMRHGLETVGGAAMKVMEDADTTYDEIDVPVQSNNLRLRVTTKILADESQASIGRVILLREISHEPLDRRFNDVVSSIVQADGDLRGVLEQASDALRELLADVEASQVETGGMGELSDRLSRTLTATENWLDVDDALAGQDFPDAQVLQDRMRVATARWTLPDEIPARVRELARRVEDYYESGENPKQRVL